MDSKFDRLVDQLANLTLFVMQSRNNKKLKGPDNSNGTPGDNQQNTERRYSYCQRPGHYPNQCPDNPHRNTIFNSYGLMGHIEATCSIKEKNPKNT